MQLINKLNKIKNNLIKTIFNKMVNKLVVLYLSLWRIKVRELLDSLYKNIVNINILMKIINKMEMK
jgi:hypothetical protein